jgi:hypothetical protein
MLKPKQRAFLAAFASCGILTPAAKKAKVARAQHYVWKKDPEYSAAFEEATDEACELLEAEARRRAATGTLKPVFYQGKKCGSVREYSDVLLMFLLKSLKPERYRDNAKIEHAGPNGGPLEVRVTFVRASTSGQS